MRAVRRIVGAVANAVKGAPKRNYWDGDPEAFDAIGAFDPLGIRADKVKAFPRKLEVALEAREAAGLAAANIMDSIMDAVAKKVIKSRDVTSIIAWEEAKKILNSAETEFEPISDEERLKLEAGSKRLKISFETALTISRAIKGGFVVPEQEALITDYEASVLERAKPATAAEPKGASAVVAKKPEPEHLY